MLRPTSLFLKVLGAAGATLLLIALSLSLQSPAFAQQTGMVSGTVLDVTDAVVPGAHVVLTNQATRDVRHTLSNGEGFFSFPSLVSGDYLVRVEAAGFSRFEQTGIHVLPGDKQYLSRIRLKVGTASESVTVEASATSINTVDTPEKSAVITSDDMNRLGTDGRNATELLKTLPGFAIRGANKVNNQAGYDPNVQTIANSATGSFGANGMAPQTGGMSITSDGAQIIDPGDMGASVATVNMDMVQEVKVQTSNFSADTAKGPIVINAIGKSGSQTTHGSAYLYARDGSMNSMESYLNAQNSKLPSGSKIAKPADRYLYPGGNIGGPVSIPGTNLKDHMFYFAGFEYYHQTIPFPTPISAQVPTDGERNGDFSWASMAPLCANQMPVGWTPYPNGSPVENPGQGPVYCGTPTYFYNAVNQTMTKLTTPGDVSQYIDPGGAAIMKLFPKSNVTATADNGWSNYISEPVTRNNSWQGRGRLDYNFNDNSKLYGAYNVQREGDPVVQGIYWAPGNAISYPGMVSQDITSHSISLNFLHVFSPSLTNEAKASLVHFNGPFTLGNPSAVSREKLGFPYTGAFQNGTDQMPTLINWWPGGYPMIYMQGGFANNSMVSKKTAYTMSDDISKVINTHTLKAGIYYERTANGQFQFAQTNSDYEFSDTWRFIWSGAGGNANGWQGCDGSNPVCFNNVADLLMGLPTTYKQDQKALAAAMYYKNISFYGTDSWKVTKRLTLDFGARFDYVGPWTDSHGVGFAVFDPALYAQQATQDTSNGWLTTSSSVQYPGMTWHAINNKIPLSGAPNHAPFVSPRFGLSWDMFGKGNTVLRGGWGMYRWHDPYNPYAGALNPGLGQQTISAQGPLSFASIDAMAANLQGQFGPDGSAYFIDRNDTQQPLTTNWNLTINQAMPWHSTLELGYVGNESKHLIPPGQLTSVNIIPIGALYQGSLPSAAIDSNVKGLISNLSGNEMDQYRPYSWYSETLQSTSHRAWSNYHALQASWNRQKGMLTYGLNYTWSKALGLFTDADPTRFQNNYGPLNFDRTHAVNATYSIDIGQRVHGNKFLAGVANGWMISGITTMQSGLNIQSANDSNSTNFGFGSANILNPNFDPNAAITAPNASVYYLQTNSANILGTPDVTLQPTISCDPTSGMPNVSNSYMNTLCYSVPNLLQNGPVWKGYFSSPMYFDSDLTIAKSFHMGERKQLQFRISAFNFLNHPLLSFNESQKSNITLSMSSATGTYCPSQVPTDARQTNCYLPGQRLLPTDFGGNQTAAGIGYLGKAATTFGRRTVMLGVKFEF
jgi:hypothetical protein